MSRVAKIEFVCRQILGEVIGGTMATSAVGKVLDLVMQRSFWRIQVAEIWRRLEDDKELQDAIVKKVQRQEKCMTDQHKEGRLRKQSVTKNTWIRKHQDRQMEENMIGLASMMSGMRVAGLEPWRKTQIDTEVEELEVVWDDK